MFGIYYLKVIKYNPLKFDVLLHRQTILNPAEKAADVE